MMEVAKSFPPNVDDRILSLAAIKVFSCHKVRVRAVGRARAFFLLFHGDRAQPSLARTRIRESPSA